jgi:phosphoglycolate phosphatase-like HAD superfamily hydrolase
VTVPQPVDTVVLDVDGTLVDTVYQHTLAWVAAFDSVDVVVPVYRIHRAIGMGSDLLVTEVAGDDVEALHGDEVRACHDRLFDEAISRVHPLPGAADLLMELRRRGLKVVLATSGLPEQTERLLALVDAVDMAQDSPTSDDVENSKPAPDLIEAAIDRAGGTRAAVIGDAVWDVAAAKKAGHYSIGLNTGGFSGSELREAGADEVYPTPLELLEALDGTPLSGV